MEIPLLHGFFLSSLRLAGVGLSGSVAGGPLTGLSRGVSSLSIACPKELRVQILVTKLLWHSGSFRSSSFGRCNNFMRWLVQNWWRKPLVHFHPALQRYLLALGLLALAFGIRFALSPLFGPRSSYLFFIP